MRITDKKEHVFLLIVFMVLIPVFIWALLNGHAEGLFFIVLCAVMVVRSVFMLFRYWEVDKIGVTEHLLWFSKRLLWSEMKYTGLWTEGSFTVRGFPRTYIVCSKSCFPQNKTKDQLRAHHWPRSQTILIPHQTDQLYFEFLTYCGGERNIQT